MFPFLDSCLPCLEASVSFYICFDVKLLLVAQIGVVQHICMHRHVPPIDYTASTSLRTGEFLPVNQSCNKDWISSSCFYISKLFLFT